MKVAVYNIESHERLATDMLNQVRTLVRSIPGSADLVDAIEDYNLCLVTANSAIPLEAEEEPLSIDPEIIGWPPIRVKGGILEHLLRNL